MHMLWWTKKLLVIPSCLVTLTFIQNIKKSVQCCNIDYVIRINVPLDANQKLYSVSQIITYWSSTTFLALFFCRQHRIHNKKGTRWTSYDTKVPKTYPHIPYLMTEIVRCRLLDRGGMQKKMVLSPKDPRRISSTIAPTEPPPTSILSAEKKSRLEPSTSRREPSASWELDTRNTYDSCFLT